jgi:hypothetical protein
MRQKRVPPEEIDRVRKILKGINEPGLTIEEAVVLEKARDGEIQDERLLAAAREKLKRILSGQTGAGDEGKK